MSARGAATSGSVSKAAMGMGGVGCEALMRHLSSSLPDRQCGLRRSLKVVWKEEVGCSAKIRGQSAGVGPGLDPLPALSAMPEVHRERTLTFLADVPLD